MIQELSQIINSNNRNAPLQIIHWLQTHHVEIVMGKFDQMSDFVKGIFSLFSQLPNNYSEEEWERITMIGYIFVISVSPPPNLIPKLPFPKTYGPLFSTVLLLNSWRPPDADTKKNYVNFFRIAVEYFNTGFKTPKFYSRSPIYFYQLIPTLLEREILSDEFIPQILYFLRSISNVQSSDLNFDFVIFTSEIIKRLKNVKKISKELISAYKRIFELSSQSGCIFLQHFFFSWLYFVNKFYELNPNDLGIFLEQIDTVTKLFSSTASLKHHELHRTFNWKLCFYFYDFVKKEEYQERILSLICNGIRRVSRFDQVSGVPQMVKKFSDDYVHTFKTKDSWAMYYYLSSLDSTVRGLVTDLQRIVGAASMNSTQNEPIAKVKVFFADENTGRSPLDFELYALYPERFFKKPEDVVPYFDLMTKYCESIRNHLSSVALFQLTFTKSIQGILNQNIESIEEYSIQLNYFLCILRSWTQLMIVVSHRENVMNTYAQREIQSYPNFPKELLSKIKNPRRQLDFRTLFARFFEIINGFHSKLYIILAAEMAKEMFESIKKGLLTYTLIELFQNLPINNEKDYNSLLITNLLSKMMEIAANHAHLFFSQSTSDTTLIYQWILFTIRLGAAMTNNKPNGILGLILSTYDQLLIKAIIFSIKRIANQSIVLRTVTVFIQQVQYHNQLNQQASQAASNQSQNDTKNRRKGLSKSLLIEEIYESAKYEAFDTLLTYFSNYPEYMDLQYMMPFLESSFQIGDKQLISKAASLCLKKFQIELSTKSYQEIEPFSTLFPSFFSSINKVDNELGKDILKIMPIFASFYLQNIPEDINAHRKLVIKEYGFEMDSILEAVTYHLGDNEEITAALFSLISCCFSIIIQNLHIPASYYTNTMRQLIVLLCHCWCNNHLHPQIDHFSTYLASEFGEAFICGDSHVFILCLLDVAGYNRSLISKIALDLAKTFFERIKDRHIDSHIIQSTIANILSSFSFSTRLFSTLCGLSLLNRYLPGHITVDQIRSFLVQTTEIPIVDFNTPQIINRFLKEYLNNISDDEKELFVQMVYDIICPLSISIRDVLTKRVEKLKIPMPITSASDLDINQESLFFQRMTLLFLCGHRGNFEIPQTIYQRISDVLSQQPSPKCNFDRLTRMLSLLYSILKNDEALSYYKSKNQMIIFLRFLCSPLTSRFTPLNKIAKKCFLVIKSSEINDEKFTSQLSDFYRHPQKIFKFFDATQDRINFYIRLTKLFYNDIPTTTIGLFFNAVFEYGTFPATKKMQFIPHFIKILKFFTVKNYILRDNIKSIIISKVNDPNLQFNVNPNLTYMENYINVIVHLYENNNAPLITIARKYVVRFLVMLANQTVSYLMYHSKAIFTFTFLYDIITYDESMTFFNSFIEHLKQISDYKESQPALFKIAEDLSVIKKFGSDQNFLTALEINFDQLYNIVTNAQTRNQNDFTLISSLATAIINAFRYQISVNAVISFIRIFTISYFARSNVSKLFLFIVFKKSSQEFLDNLLDYVVSNATKLQPIYIHTLLPHLIRNINKPSISYLWKMLPQWAVDCIESRYAFLHSILSLLKKYNPTEEALKNILEVIKTTISAADIRLVMYSLKTATCLSKMKLLPPKVYFSIFRQFFTYPKFSEPPYSKYFFAFLKSDPDRLTQISSQDCNILSYYMHNRFLHLRELQKVFSPFNSVFVAAPQLVSYLPFSLITSVGTILENRLNNPNKLEANEVNDIFIYAANFCQIMKTSQEELDFFIKVCFHYLKILLFDHNNPLAQQGSTDFYNVFYNLLTGYKTSSFPKEIIDNINKNMSKTTKYPSEYFGLICGAAHNIPDILFTEFSDLAIKTLQFAEVDNNINNEYLRCFMTEIVLFQERQSKIKKSQFLKSTSSQYQHSSASKNPLDNDEFDIFEEAIHHAFEATKHIYIQNADRLFIISKAIISHKTSKCLDSLWEFYDELKESSVDRKPLLRFLINCIPDVPLDKQIQTVQMIFSKVRYSAKKTHVFTTSLPVIFQSTTLKNSAKEYIVENLIPLLLIDKLCNAEKMLAMLYEYSKKAAFDCSPYIIQLLLIRAHRANNSGCLLFIERVMEMLPCNFKDRISYLIMTLPIEMWEDSFLPVIIALLTPKIPIWQPLFTLAHKLRPIGGELVAITFSKLIDESNTILFQQFLARLLKSHLKVKHNQIISGVLTMFHRKGIKIAYHLAEKAIKYSGNLHQLQFFLEPCTRSVPTHRYLLPHDANDIIFSTYLPYLTHSQTAAVALTFLHEYEAAQSLYEREILYSQDIINESSKFLEQMEKTNNHFIIKNDHDIHSLLRPLTFVGRTNAALEWLEVAANSYQRNLDDAALQKVTESNLSTTIGKKFFSQFEKQRLCLIQAMVLLIDGKPQFNADESCMIRSFIELYNKFNNFLNNLPNQNSAVIDKMDKEAIILVSSEMKNKFQKVCGISPIGLIAVGKSHIEAYINDISNKINSNSMTATDFKEFASFSFAVYCAHPTPELNSMAFNAYCKIFVDDTLNYPQYVVHEAAARIITMCRIAFSSNDENFLINTVSKSVRVFGESCVEKWRFWLPHLVELARSSIFCDLIYDILKKMPYRVSLYANKDNIQTLHDLVHKIAHETSTSQISIMEYCSKFFESIFSIDFYERENQEHIVNFANETLKLFTLNSEDLNQDANLPDGTNQERKDEHIEYLKQYKTYFKEKIQNNIDDFDLLALRKQFPTTPFERALRSLTFNQIQQIGDFKQFVKNVIQAKDINGIIDYVKEITHSQHSLAEIRNTLSNCVHSVNKNLPFIFPLRLEKPIQITINQIQDEFTFLSNNMLVMTMLSNIHSWRNYIVQKSTNEKGFHKSVLTLANTMFLVKMMLQHNYSACKRNLSLFPSQFFEVGASIILIPVISKPETLEIAFRESEMYSTNEWINKYTRKEESQSDSDKKLVLTSEGEVAVSNINTNYLFQKYMKEIGRDALMKVKSVIADSSIISGLFRHIFGASYPCLSSCIFCPNSSIVPLIHSDYDFGQITDISRKVSSSFRLSPNMLSAFGNSTKGKCFINIAVMSKSLTENIESIRSYIEAIIGDEDFDNQRTRGISELVEIRSVIETKFLDFCPPTGEFVQPKDAVQWIERLDNFFEAATNPNLHPIEAIPWF